MKTKTQSIAPRNSVNAISKLAITNGCGGNKGTKCGVEVYYMPSDSKVLEVVA